MSMDIYFRLLCCVAVGAFFAWNYRLAGLHWAGRLHVAVAALGLAMGYGGLSLNPHMPEFLLFLVTMLIPVVAILRFFLMGLLRSLDVKGQPASIVSLLACLALGSTLSTNNIFVVLAVLLPSIVAILFGPAPVSVEEVKAQPVANPLVLNAAVAEKPAVAVPQRVVVVGNMPAAYIAPVHVAAPTPRALPVLASIPAEAVVLFAPPMIYDAMAV